jgi:calcium-dependent protein kinase
MLYILLSGKPPFEGDNDDEIIEKVKIGIYNISGGVWDVISTGGKNLIKKMLNYDF